MSNARQLRRLILPPTRGGRRVRNRAGHAIPCCYADCARKADADIEVAVPHEQPRWADPKTGDQEMVIYTFCCTEHRDLFTRQTGIQHHPY